ncbi:molecular chaperone TorD family protein [Adlercreutzia sp. R25]|uniref:TorD/DmsD family molecular chaperone n=1 Tax=Adlercreutzia shanghongiae TaxID=3111773 RepID=UPI002DBB0C08|nr:molecular chaperone TorD family protein [Adlercreutzia sp. R25]MEC4271923.1 molecular chaperone TorD family protein [Adlercreutzia sp. R25]
MTQRETIDFFENAQAFYGLLSSVFYLELTEEQIDGLAESGFSYPDDGSDMADACAAMRRYLARRGASARQDLAVEYARIFLAAGVYEGETAVPYESVYTSPEGILMQDSRDDAVRVYRRHGLAIPQDLNVPEDHLVFELEFMAHLSGRIAEALKADGDARGLMEAQAAFIDGHLLNWVPRLLDRVRKFARLPFYPAITQIALSYIQENRALLEEELS